MFATVWTVVKMNASSLNGEGEAEWGCNGSARVNETWLFSLRVTRLLHFY